MSRGLSRRASVAIPPARLACGLGGGVRSGCPVRLARSLALAGLAVAFFGAGCASWPFAEPEPTRPKLVVLLVVDQLRPDRLSPGQPDGLGRLQREGRVFSEAALDYAFSETCPGHVTAATGRFPSHTGIPGNRFVLEEILERVYCVLDRTPAGALVAAAPPERIPRAPGAGRSPAMLRADGIGDWLKAAYPTARVHALSGKDRSAVALGGRRPDGVWWVDVEGSGALTTSRYYLYLAHQPAHAPSAVPSAPPAASAASAATDEAVAAAVVARDAEEAAAADDAEGAGDEAAADAEGADGEANGAASPALPGWAAAWTRERLLEGVPARWIHPAHDPQGRIRDDDYFAETPWASRTSPHPLNQPEPPREPAIPLPTPGQLAHSAPTNLPEESLSSPPPAREPARTGTTKPRGDDVQRLEVMPRVAASPYLDRRLLEMALDLVDAEALGRGRGGGGGGGGGGGREGRDRRASAGADLLAIGLSATDLVGHLYGPFSQESRAALADLDEAIGEFLAALEARLGRDRVGVVLTADHGVLPLPEWARAVDLPENACPVGTGRVSEATLITRLLGAVEAEMSRAAARARADRDGAQPDGAQPDVAHSAGSHSAGSQPGSARPAVAHPAGAGPPEEPRPRLDPWLVVNGLRLHANRVRLEASGVAFGQLDAAIRDALAGEPAIARVWSREELQAPFDPGSPASGRDAGARRGDDPAIPAADALLRERRELREHRLLSHSLAPGRSPDWVLVPARGCLITGRSHGTSHGSLHDYDRRIPLIFWGPGVEPGVDGRPARLVDLAPTLARWLGLEPPTDLDGRVLPLADE